MTTEIAHLPVRGNTGIRLYLTSEADIKGQIDSLDRHIDELTRQARAITESKNKADKDRARLITELNAARTARRYIEDSETG